MEKPQNPQNPINPTPFPRLVWAVIIEFLSYRDRCSLRQACKWMATFKNRRPLLYWLRRDDPVTHCLDKDSRICILLKNGIKVDYPQDSFFSEESNIRFARAALYGNIFTGDYQIFKNNYVNTRRLLKKNYVGPVEKILILRNELNTNLDYILHTKQPEKITDDILRDRVYVIYNHALINGWHDTCERIKNILTPEEFKCHQLLYELVYEDKISVLNEIKEYVSSTDALTIAYMLAVEAINKRNYLAIELISLCSRDFTLRRVCRTRNIKMICEIAKWFDIDTISFVLIQLLKKGYIGVIKFLCKVF